MLKTIKQKAFAASGLLFASGVAFAQESPASAAMTSISTEASNLIADAWPILVAVVVAGVGMKLFKKFAGKAT